MTGVITDQQAPDPGAEGTDDNGVRQLTTLRGWRGFVADRPVIPELLSEEVWRSLGEADRFGYDEARLAHHAKLLVVATPTIQQVILEGRRLQYVNRHAEVGRCGLILSGPARTGKTTCLTQLGKTIETMHTRRHPHAAGHIPVVYITAPPAATPRMIAVEFARFLGLPLTRRANITDVLEAVCGVCLDAATTLICVDEIHNVNLGTRHGAEASDTLKYFAERYLQLTPACPERAGRELEIPEITSWTGLPSVVHHGTGGIDEGAACADARHGVRVVDGARR